MSKAKKGLNRKQAVTSEAATPALTAASIGEPKARRKSPSPPTNVLSDPQAEKRPEPRERQPQRTGRYNHREVRPIVTVNDLLVVLGGGQRLEILSLLARGPMTVGTITKRMFLPICVVSRDLATMEQRGLVVWAREKNFRWYRLAETVRANLRGEIVQLSLQVPSGHWVLVHLNESGESESPPPHASVGVT